MWLEHKRNHPQCCCGSVGAVGSHRDTVTCGSCFTPSSPHPSLPLPFPQAGLIYLPRAMAAPSGNADGCWAISGPGEAQLHWETNGVLLMGAGSEPPLLLPLLLSQGSSASSGLSWVCSEPIRTSLCGHSCWQSTPGTPAGCTLRWLARLEQQLVARCWVPQCLQSSGDSLIFCHRHF